MAQRIVDMRGRGFGRLLTRYGWLLVIVTAIAAVAVPNGSWGTGDVAFGHPQARPAEQGPLGNLQLINPVRIVDTRVNDSAANIVHTGFNASGTPIPVAPLGVNSTSR